MPELPEVETVRRILHPAVVGRTITGVTLGDFAGVLETTLEAVDPAALLVGRTIQGTARRGKYLFLHLDQELAIIIHLRMTGRLLIVPTAQSPVRFEHLAIHLDSGRDLRFGDQRKFGRVTIVRTEDIARLDARLGPEPSASNLNGTMFQARLARRPGPIKNALLDQSLIAGLGNIYVDEALYRCRIHPRQPANTLTANDTTRLIRAIRHVLNASLVNQGTTFSTFENPYGESGSNGRYLRAYGQTKSAGRCHRCGTPFARIVVAGRGTTYCPVCQVLHGPEPTSSE